MIIVLCVGTSATIPFVNASEKQTLDGSILILRGGIGAYTIIQTHYAGECFGDNPLRYYLTIEGKGVINPGSVEGVARGQAWTIVRTFFAFGFGPVTLQCTTWHNDGSYGPPFDEETVSGYMIGFLVFT